MAVDISTFLSCFVILCHTVLPFSSPSGRTTKHVENATFLKRQAENVVKMS